MHYWHWLLLEIAPLTSFYTNKSIACSVWVTLKENIMMYAEFEAYYQSQFLRCIQKIALKPWLDTVTSETRENGITLSIHMPFDHQTACSTSNYPICLNLLLVLVHTWLQLELAMVPTLMMHLQRQTLWLNERMKCAASHLQSAHTLAQSPQDNRQLYYRKYNTSYSFFFSSSIFPFCGFRRRLQVFFVQFYQN